MKAPREPNFLFCVLTTADSKKIWTVKYIYASSSIGCCPFKATGLCVVVDWLRSETLFCFEEQININLQL